MLRRRRKGATSPLRIGISSCLLGREVRYDGGHKHAPLLTETLGPFVEWVPVCPEVEAGFGVPRPPLHLERRRGDVRVVVTESGVDVTSRLGAASRARLRALRAAGLTGFVLKKGSPSCGVNDVKVVAAGRGTSKRGGRGLFARVLVEAFPNLPVEEENRLADPRIRESWIERVFAYRRLQGLWSRRWAVDELAAFHAREELTLLVRSPTAWADLDLLVRSRTRVSRADLRRRYEDGFMEAMAAPATRRRHGIVLRRVAGSLRPHLDTGTFRDVRDLVDGYGRGAVPLVVPLTVCAHHARRLGLDELARQTYLSPDWRELVLRPHA